MRRLIFDAPIAEPAEAQGISIDEAVKLRVENLLRRPRRLLRYRYGSPHPGANGGGGKGGKGCLLILWDKVELLTKSAFYKLLTHEVMKNGHCPMMTS